MIIDIIFFVTLAVFMLKGYRKGALFSLFTVLALVIGVCGALRLSATVTLLLFKEGSAAGRWAPMISYVLVFVVIVWLIRLGAALLQQSFEWLQLGFVNRLSGALLYGFLVCFVSSTFLWLLTEMDVLQSKAQEQSFIYAKIVPIAPFVFDALSHILPFVKDALNDLSDFFDSLNAEIQPYVGINR